MEMLVLIALLLALLGSSEALPCFWGWSSPQSGYTCVKLAPYYNLYYKQRQGASNISIGLEVAVPPLSDGSTVSWAGFGISQAGGMKGADIFTGEPQECKQKLACMHNNLFLFLVYSTCSSCRTAAALSHSTMLCSCIKALAEKSSSHLHCESNDTACKRCPHTLVCSTH
jgi:hypothetical protein